MYQRYPQSAAALAAMMIALGAVPASADPATAEQARLAALMESRKMTVTPTLQRRLDDGRVLSLVRVELAPGVTEPHHTHPGPEILYGLGGSGTVDIDGKAWPISAGTVVEVGAGAAKAISNPSESAPLRLLAVLVLDPQKPPLTVVVQPGKDDPAPSRAGR